MKGTQEKFDLLTCKPQEAGQDGLTYVKLCQRREMQLYTGTTVADVTLRQFIEDCVERLRIAIFRTRVSEQLRVQFPPPSKVTWKDVEGIVEEITRRCGCKYPCWEAQQHGLDLKAIRASLKKVDAEAVAQHDEDADVKKHFDNPSPSKKVKKEVDNAERAKKSFNSTPPLAMRMYNLKNCFKNSDWGIRVQDWTKLPKAEKDKYRMVQPTSEKKASIEKTASLKAEYQSMVATLQTGSRSGSLKSQVLSEDEEYDEEVMAARAAEREVYSVGVHEVNCREIFGPESSQQRQCPSQTQQALPRLTLMCSWSNLAPTG
ncbi:hypothetical protein CYMTET_43233 [Cymbomonas tetramitiformis]|uniref:Uncharacterized protein n=1 Tax=Cymbomonas tetramitiformis TaxID=36881 RepID=A0AAE0C3V9_9CHLO|nr:hypothetical protein CYMTET_43233 [Cymbomonas tetramitiformis]